MHTELLIRFASLLLFLVATDLILYFSLQNIFFKMKTKSIAYRYFFWLPTLMYFLYFIATLIFVGSPLDNPVKYRAYFWVFGVFILLYAPKFIMALVISTGYFLKLMLRIFLKKVVEKSNFNLKYFAKTGIVCGAAVFLILLYGFIITKTNFAVRHYSLEFNNLPVSFNNLKIVHISDAHLGSFSNKDEVKKAVNLIRKENPDILFFTGDLINVSYIETIPYKDAFKEIKPKYGMYSILGNHDIGDYAKWDTIPNQGVLNNKLIQAEKNMGFNVLIDTNIKIFAGKDSICIAGVNNCGPHPFKRRGNIKRALQGIENNNFVILLTHDAAIWSGEIADKTNVNLTLAGHTHGMQLGIDTKYFKWSPIAIKYKYWFGLYEFDEQYLFVNSGLGFLGFPGRIGIAPEISVITLKKRL